MSTHIITFREHLRLVVNALTLGDVGPIGQVLLEENTRIAWNALAEIRDDAPSMPEAERKAFATELLDEYRNRSNGEVVE
jgi:hypothetical protein